MPWQSGLTGPDKERASNSLAMIEDDKEPRGREEGRGGWCGEDVPDPQVAWQNTHHLH